LQRDRGVRCQAASKVDAGAVQPRLYGTGRRAKRRSNLLARESFDVVQKDGIALRRRQQRYRVAYVRERGWACSTDDKGRCAVARVRYGAVAGFVAASVSLAVAAPWGGADGMPPPLIGATYTHTALIGCSLDRTGLVLHYDTPGVRRLARSQDISCGL
jgi:hypothetical protein